MSFDYLYDLFGRFREKETKFSEVEERAKKLLSYMLKGMSKEIPLGIKWR